MNFNEYQQLARSTQIYGKEHPENYIIYPAIGLGGESGEVLENIKKMLRDDKRKLSQERKEKLKKELGDVLWYVANLAYDLGLNLDDIAQTNIEKLTKRREQNKIHGEGDNREEKSFEYNKDSIFAFVDDLPVFMNSVVLPSGSMSVREILRNAGFYSLKEITHKEDSIPKFITVEEK